MKSAGKARNNGLYRHIRTSKEIIRNLLNDLYKNRHIFIEKYACQAFCIYAIIILLPSGDCLEKNTGRA